MNNEKPYNNLFEETGCLGESALFGYAKGTLSKSDLRAVEMHITDCDLCFDAVEGMRLVKKTSFVVDTKAEIIQKLYKTNDERKIFYLTNKNVRLLAAASMILGISGLAGWYFLSNVEMNSEIAALETKNIPDSISPVLETQKLMNESEVLEKENREDIIKPESIVLPPHGNNKTKSTQTKEASSDAGKRVSESPMNNSNSDSEVLADVLSISKDTKKNVLNEPAVDKSVSAPAITIQEETVFSTATVENTTRTSKEKQKSKYQDNEPAALNTFDKKDMYYELLEKGKSFYFANTADSAIRYLSLADKSENPEIKAEANYYLGLTYVKNNQVNKAKEIFRILSRSKTSYKDSAATKLKTLE